MTFIQNCPSGINILNFLRSHLPNTYVHTTDPCMAMFHILPISCLWLWFLEMDKPIVVSRPIGQYCHNQSQTKPNSLQSVRGGPGIWLYMNVLKNLTSHWISFRWTKTHHVNYWQYFKLILSPFNEIATENKKYLAKPDYQKSKFISFSSVVDLTHQLKYAILKHLPWFISSVTCALAWP